MEENIPETPRGDEISINVCRKLPNSRSKASNMQSSLNFNSQGSDVSRLPLKLTLANQNSLNLYANRTRGKPSSSAHLLKFSTKNQQAQDKSNSKATRKFQFTENPSEREERRF